MPNIKAQNLCLRLGERDVFHNLNFDWNKNRIAIIGRNGSGKSSLARLIAGLISPDSGEIQVDNTDLFKNRKTALQKIGIVFQNPDHQIIFPTVIEELRFGFEQKGTQNAEIIAENVLKKYGKADWRDRVVANLSQGQRHFLALISILEMQPEILVLDEPFTGLDIPTVMRLQNLLAQFEGTIIHITHEPELVSDYQYAVWLEEGKIEGEGEAKSVINNYQKQMKIWGETDARTGF